MKKLEDIKDFTDIIEFTDGYDIFKKDNRARTALNKTLETNYKAVYRKTTRYSQQWEFGNIDWSGEEFLAVTAKDRLLRFSNSEWAWFQEEK